MAVVVLGLVRCAVVEGVVGAGCVPPVRPLERRVLGLGRIVPGTVMDRLVLVRAVHVLSQRVIVRSPNRPSRWHATRIDNTSRYTQH